MSVFLTAKLKVHNPSARKRQILDRALEEYTRAYGELLQWAKDNLSTIEEKGRYNGRFTEPSVRGALPPASFLKHHRLHSSARHSLLIDVAGTLTSYLQLREENPLTAFPTCRDPAPETYPDALEDMADVADDEMEYNQCRDRLLRVAKGTVMPVFFSRPDGVPGNRNFSLLVDPEKQRYYALLFLLPGDQGNEPMETRGNLVRMGWPRGKDAAEARPHFTARPGGAVLLPLEMGGWHGGTFMEPCLRGEANVRAAFLSRDDSSNRVRRGGLPQYYVHVTFEYSPEKVKTETVLGVDRGLANLIALTVTDKRGEIIHQELHSGEDLIDLQKYAFTEYRKRQRRGRDISGQRVIARANEEVCHRLANVIVEVAQRHRSQVVMEDLKWFKERRRDFGLLKRAPLQRIQQILGYKLPLKGLPRLKLVSAAYTSRECPRCGYGLGVKGRGVNRPSQAEFCCERCGYQTHADLNGSHNVARKWQAIITRRGAASTLAVS